ncbi:MAG: nickel-type superoxide dismutase maturation protease [Acidimicrobiales bacterium]
MRATRFVAACLTGTVAAIAVRTAAAGLGRVVVEGTSMVPSLRPGDRLLVVRPSIDGRRGIRPGDVVAVRDPRQPTRVLVKRVSAVHRPQRAIDVAGDASDSSTDSRTFGSIPVALLVGRAVYRYHPAHRSGVLVRPAEYDRS